MYFPERAKIVREVICFYCSLDHLIVIDPVIVRNGSDDSQWWGISVKLVDLAVLSRARPISLCVGVFIERRLIAADEAPSLLVRLLQLLEDLLFSDVPSPLRPRLGSLYKANYLLFDVV